MSNSSSKNASSLSSTSVEDDFVLIERGAKFYKFLKRKNQELERKFGFNFEFIILKLAANAIVSTVEANQERHPDHKIAVLDLNNKCLQEDHYLHEVPFLAEVPNIIFLKTIYPSRKMMFKCWGVPRKPKKRKKRLKRKTAVNVSISIPVSTKK